MAQNKSKRKHPDDTSDIEEKNETTSKEPIAKMMKPLIQEKKDPGTPLRLPLSLPLPLPDHPRKAEWIAKAKAFKILYDQACRAGVPAGSVLMYTNVHSSHHAIASGDMASINNCFCKCKKSTPAQHEMLVSDLVKRLNSIAIEKGVQAVKHARNLPYGSFSINVAMRGAVGMMPICIVAREPLPESSMKILKNMYDVHQSEMFGDMKHTRLDILWDNSLNIDGKEGMAVAIGKKAKPKITNTEYRHYMNTVFEILSIILPPDEMRKVKVYYMTHPLAIE
jgi:hypothetical protein